jgi:hypothetical protein
MRARPLHDVARVGFAGCGIAAIAYQYASLVGRPEFRPANFFSFFTIQSNVLAVAILALAAVVRREERSLAFDALRSAVTLYMAITGVVFARRATARRGPSRRRGSPSPSPGSPTRSSAGRRSAGIPTRSSTSLSTATGACS